MIKKNNFTMVELLAAMAVLSIFMFGMIRLFTSIQKMMTVTTAKNELFGSSRVVMDMIANDLECIHVNRDKDGKCMTLLAKDVGNHTEYLRLAARRTERMSGSSSNVACVSYDFDYDNMSLKMTSFGDSSRLWNIGDKTKKMDSANHNFSNLVNEKNAVEIMDGVVNFQVTFLKRQDGKMFPSVLSADEVRQGELPDEVILNLDLVDTETLKKIEAALELDVFEGGNKTLTRKEIAENEKAQRLLDENTRTFTRTVPILR